MTPTYGTASLGPSLLSEQNTEVSRVAMGRVVPDATTFCKPGVGVGQGHDASKTIFAMLPQLLQDTSIIDALGIVANLPREARR